MTTLIRFDAFSAEVLAEVVDLPDAKERRSYAILQAAAILAGSHWAAVVPGEGKQLDLAEEVGNDAASFVDTAEALLAAIERRGPSKNTARLIAAAPDLLEALKAVWSGVDLQSPELAGAVHDAIAKAEGI